MKKHAESILVAGCIVGLVMVWTVVIQLIINWNIPDYCVPKWGDILLIAGIAIFTISYIVYEIVQKRKSR